MLVISSQLQQKPKETSLSKKPKGEKNKLNDPTWRSWKKAGNESWKRNY